MSVRHGQVLNDEIRRLESRVDDTTQTQVWMIDFQRRLCQKAERLRVAAKRVIDSRDDMQGPGHYIAINSKLLEKLAAILEVTEPFEFKPMPADAIKRLRRFAAEPLLKKANRRRAGKGNA